MHHTRIGPVIMNAKFFQFQVFVPRQHHQPTVKHGVNVVPEARIVSVFVRVQAPTHFHVFLDHHDLLAALTEIARTDHAVVSRADHNAVVFQYFCHDKPGTFGTREPIGTDELCRRGSNRSSSSSRSNQFSLVKASDPLSSPASSYIPNRP